jgi:hypothetical protein
MTTTTLTGLIARETEKAVAFMQHGESKPLWLPRKKIASLVELDERSQPVQIQGEKLMRQGIPVQVEVETAFLARVAA